MKNTVIRQAGDGGDISIDNPGEENVGRVSIFDEGAPRNRNGKIKLGARKCGTFIAVCTAPSINRTPRGGVMVPVAYSTTADLSNSIGVAKSVFFNGAPAFLFDSSSQPSCKGDERGIGGGVRSGTFNGEVKPLGGSRSVRIEGKSVVRQGDTCTMNGGNNLGAYVCISAPASKSISRASIASNQQIGLETPEEKGAFSNWFAEVRKNFEQAVKHPGRATVGAVKGTVNTIPEFGDVLKNAVEEQRATEFDEAALTLKLLGHDSAADESSTIAFEFRKQSANSALPKYEFANSAEAGGASMAALLQIFAAGFGVAKFGVKWVAKARSPAVAKAGSSLTKATDIGPSSNISEATDGFRIVGKTSKSYKPKSKREGKYANRTEVIHRPAADVNATYPEGWSPPYKPGTQVTEFTTTNDDMYVRVHGEGNMARSWMMRKEAIEDLSPAQIKSKYALPELPKFLSEVHVPAGTRIRSGIVNPIFGGSGNAIQYELLERLPTSMFKNTTKMKNGYE